jgi:hypothetical protein
MKIGKNKMKNIYYQLWVDCIVSIRRNNPDWKWITMLSVNLAMSLNMMFIIVTLSLFFPVFKKYELPIIFLNGSRLVPLFGYCILYGLPIQLINYYFIFYKKKYEHLILTYPFYDGKYFITYFLLSLGVAFIGVTIIFFTQK